VFSRPPWGHHQPDLIIDERGFGDPGASGGQQRTLRDRARSDDPGRGALGGDRIRAEDDFGVEQREEGIEIAGA
jgi:hypothetical protein